MADLSDIITPTNVLTATSTNTVTNKTISGTNNTITNVSLTGATGTLPVANGGTGATTLTANNVLLGNGTSALQEVAPSTSGNVLTSNGTTWTSATPTAPVASTPVVTRTSNTIFGTADAGKLFVYTSGTFTQTFTAAATLGNGWSIEIRNSGTGVITLDPNASETIDGRTTIRVYPSESFLVVCSGTLFFTVGRSEIVSISSTLSGATSFSITAPVTDTEIVRTELVFQATSFTGSCRLDIIPTGATVSTTSSAITGINTTSYNSSSNQSSIFNDVDTASTSPRILSLAIVGMSGSVVLFNGVNYVGGFRQNLFNAQSNGAISDVTIQVTNGQTANGSSVLKYYR